MAFAEAADLVRNAMNKLSKLMAIPESADGEPLTGENVSIIN